MTPLGIQRLYGEIWAMGSPEFDEVLVRSLSPSGMERLLDLFAEAGVKAGDRVLDVGCRDASWAVDLVRRFGCHVLAIDPVPVHMEWARKCIEEAGLEERITARLGQIEAIPAEDGAIDIVWSRDMLNHVDLPAGLRECARVLRPGGRMFIYITLAGEFIEPAELNRLCAAQAIVPENMSSTYLEQTATEAGFHILRREVIGSEWQEAALERESGKAAVEALLHLSRMRRLEEDLVRRFGRERYEATYTGDLWIIYILLGKLSPMVYILETKAD
jgi:ubiquinone/menaquinone biosynthesis C-methylase UbiE